MGKGGERRGYGWGVGVSRACGLYTCMLRFVILLVFLVCASVPLFARGGEHLFHLPSGKMVFRHFLVHLSLCLWIHLGLRFMYMVCFVHCLRLLYICACEVCLYMDVHVMCVCTCCC